MKNKRSIGDIKSESAALDEVKAARKSEDRSKKWQLTENNAEYTKTDAVKVLTGIGEAVYCVASSECGASGTKHIHAFVVFKNAISMSTLKKHFPRAHFEHCRGSVASNREYVIKDDKEPVEVGECPLALSEERTDAPGEVVALIVKSGRSPLEILTAYPKYADYVVRNFRNLNEIYEQVQGVMRRNRR